LLRILPVLPVCAALFACGPATSGTAAPRAPTATTTPAPGITAAPGPSAEPAPEPGERPLVACSAKHPIPELTLATLKPEAWSQATHGYRPQASGGRPTAWDGDTASVDAYLDGVHACAHAAFADSFLRSLRELPKAHPLSDPELSATVELVIDGETGKLAEVGIVGSSGVAEFDAAAVAAFSYAFPLEGAPPVSLSSDGRLYVSWELKRNPEEACQRAQARPWKLRF
jgi:hypothetical protein